MQVPFHHGAVTRVTIPAVAGRAARRTAQLWPTTHSTLANMDHHAARSTGLGVPPTCLKEEKGATVGFCQGVTNSRSADEQSAPLGRMSHAHDEHIRPFPVGIGVSGRLPGTGAPVALARADRRGDRGIGGR